MCPHHRLRYSRQLHPTARVQNRGETQRPVLESPIDTYTSSQFETFSRVHETTVRARAINVQLSPDGDC